MFLFDTPPPKKKMLPGVTGGATKNLCTTVEIFETAPTRTESQPVFEMLLSSTSDFVHVMHKHTSSHV